MKHHKRYFNCIGFVLLLLTVISCETSSKTPVKASAEESLIDKVSDNTKPVVGISIDNGPRHNHPTFAVWIEDMDGTLLQTLFVTRSIATGTFKYAADGEGKWKKEPGEAIRPAALPVWLHKREGSIPGGALVMPTKANPFPDAFTGATPENNCKISASVLKALPVRFAICLEVNQPWDWNPYWSNSKFPQDSEYLTSAQPSVVYAVTIDLNKPMDHYSMNPIGHGHYAGKDGHVYSDLSTITSALQIFNHINVSLNQQ